MRSFISILWAAFALVLGASKSNAACDGPNCQSLAVRTSFDINLQSGKSDRLGDRKSNEMVYRRGSWIFGLTTDLITPQKNTTTLKQFDTATLKLIFGHESEYWGVYGMAGVANGAFLDVAHSAVDSSHQLMGWGKSRKSPASSAGKAIVEFSGRADFVIYHNACEPLCISATATPYFIFGNSNVRAGLATYAVFSSAGSDISKPDIAALPAVASTGTYFRVGLVNQAIGYALVTDQLGTSHFQTTISSGIGFEKNNWSLSGNLQIPLLPEINGEKARPIPFFSIQLSRKL